MTALLYTNGIAEDQEAASNRKPREGLCGRTSNQQVLRRRKAASSISFPWSEESQSEAESDNLEPPPPKSGTNVDSLLTFPMGGNRPALPVCDGPRMKPFSNRNVQVQFVRELGDNAMHSNVFQVNIDGKGYALKLFRTFKSSFYPDFEDWNNIWAHRPDPRVAANLFKPFYRECRAYARIVERGIQDRYWRCYGYLKLPSRLREDLCAVTGLPEFYWQVRPDHFGRIDLPTQTSSKQLNWPTYGLVKELAPVSAPIFKLRQRNVRVMLADLKQLQKAGITNNDIADRNYIEGRLVDFSHSYTLPHMWYDEPRRLIDGKTL